MYIAKNLGVILNKDVSTAELQSGRRCRIDKRFRVILCVSTALVVMGGWSVAPGIAQERSSRPTGATDVIELDTVTLEGAGNGQTKGLVAKRSAAASKTDTPLLETPQAVSVVTSDQIEAQNAASVAQALRYTPGVLSDPQGYDIRYDWLFIRGFDTYGTIWLDGLVLPGDPLNYATPTVHPYTLDRVEVIKGPASVLYGRAVPGGLVNQVSKRPQAEAHREVEVGTSSFGGVQGRFDATGPLTEGGDWLYRIVGLAENMGSQIDLERSRKLVLAPSVTWAPSDATSLTLHGYLQRDRDTFSPRFYPATGTLLPNPAGQIPRDLFLGDPDAGGFNRDFFTLGYEFEHDFNETWTVRQNLRYGRSDQDMFLTLVNPAFAYNGPGTVLNRVSAVSDDSLTSFSVDNQAEAHFQTGSLDHTALFGLDYINSESSTNFGNTGQGTRVPSIDYLNPVYGLAIPVAPVTRSGLQEQEQVGFYAQDQIKFDRWVATLGLRYDKSEIDSTNRLRAGTPTVTTEDGQLSTRAGITYLFDNGVAPYASYMTSFLPQLGTDRLGAPFEAQTAEQFEVGVKYEPPGGIGLVGVSLFQLTVENALTPDPLNTLFSTQGGKQRVRGIEVEGKAALSDSFDILASYAYSPSKILETTEPLADGREVLRLPEHQASVWAQYRPEFLPGVSLSGGLRYLSAYQTDAKYLSQLRIPDRTLVDLGAEYDFGALRDELKGTKLQVNATNLLDESYVAQCLNTTGGSCNYGEGRAVRASLKYSW